MTDIVECHSDYTYAEKPIALTWEGQRLEIIETSLRWRTPEGNGFRVRTHDGQEFILLYKESADEWQITRP